MLLPLTASSPPSCCSFIPRRRRAFICSSKGSGPRSDRKAASKLADGALDAAFEERLRAVRRSAVQQKMKKAEEGKQYGPIDYEAPVEAAPGFATKVGLALATLVFGLVFAFGDFLPTYSDTPSPTASPQDRARLEATLQQFEQALSISHQDTQALRGAAVTLAELGEYDKAASRLEELTKKKPNDPDAFRLLGEVKYELKDYEASAKAYATAARVSKSIDFEVVRGTTNALLAANKPGEAVQVLLSIREQLNKDKPVFNEDKFESNPVAESSQVDPIQVDLLLGKAYSDWGRVSDSIAIYDQLISSHPDDFRGYLAKGIILKENGNVGGAERMFIQARFYAPEKARPLVDRYSK